MNTFTMIQNELEIHRSANESNFFSLFLYYERTMRKISSNGLNFLMIEKTGNREYLFLMPRKNEMKAKYRMSY